MNATTYTPAGRAVEETEVQLDLDKLVCGGCYANTIAACVTKRREHGERLYTSYRSVYCYTCGRTSAKPLTIAEFPVGGWAAMSEALREVEATRQMRGGGA